MTTLPALPLPISTQAPLAEAGTASGRHGAGKPMAFPQLLSAQRQAGQADGHGARARGGDEQEAETRASQQDDAALQLIAILLPEAAAQPGKPIDGPAAPGLEARQAGPRMPLPPDGDAVFSPSAHASQPVARTEAEGLRGATEAASPPSFTDLSPALDHKPLPAKLSNAGRNENTAAVQGAPALLQPPAGKASETGVRAAAQPAVGAPADPVFLAPQTPQANPADAALNGAAAGISPPTAGLPGQAAPISGAPGVSLFVPAPLAHPGWGQAMARQVGLTLQSAAQGIQQAELRLDPPDLGPLRVTLQIQDNVAHAWFVSSHASVRQAVESALPHLAQQLADAGLSLGEAHVGSEQAGRQPPSQPGPHRAVGPAADSPQADSAAAGGAAPRPASSDGHLLIDTYA